jgi:hypothetical protein
MSNSNRFWLIASACLLIAGQADAHAHLKSAVPAPDSVVKPAPTELDLTFTEGLILKFSNVTVTGPRRAAVKIGEPMLMDDDMTLMVPFADALAAGHYKVEWRALSTDGHKSKGEFGFTVQP